MHSAIWSFVEAQADDQAEEIAQWNKLVLLEVWNQTAIKNQSHMVC